MAAKGYPLSGVVGRFGEVFPVLEHQTVGGLYRPLDVEGGGDGEVGTVLLQLHDDVEVMYGGAFVEEGLLTSDAGSLHHPK